MTGLLGLHGDFGACQVGAGPSTVVITILLGRQVTDFNQHAKQLKNHMLNIGAQMLTYVMHALLRRLCKLAVCSTQALKHELLPRVKIANAHIRDFANKIRDPKQCGSYSTGTTNSTQN